MVAEQPLRVFILEDNHEIQDRILEECKSKNYKISFFSKEESPFELFSLNPDIVIQDYQQNKMIKFYEWAK